MRESGVNGWTPQHHTRSSSLMSSSSVSPNRWHTSAIVGPSWATTHGTSASSRRSRSSAETRGTLQPIDELGAEILGGEHLGVVEESEDEGTEGVAVRHRELDDHGAVVPFIDHLRVAQVIEGP